MPDHSAWSHYKPITVQDANVDADLSDFPLLVVLDGDTDIGSRCRADGFDLRFTLDDGVTALKYDRLGFNVAAGSAAGKFWVKVPSIGASGGAALRIYYGNASAVDGADAAGVWTNYEAVLHLNDTGSTAADATGNGHTGTIDGPVRVAGIIDDCRDFSVGINDGPDNIIVPDDGNLEGCPELLVELWALSRSAGVNGVYGVPIGKDHYIADDDWSFYHNGLPHMTVEVNGRTAIALNSVAADTWYHALLAYKRNTTGGIAIYMDGTLGGATDALDENVASSTNDVWIGGRYSSGKWDGRIEEVRIAQTASPSGNLAAYAKFVHANVTEPDHEVSFGTATPNDQCWWSHHFILAARETFCTGPTEGSTFHAGIVTGEVDGRAS